MKTIYKTGFLGKSAARLGLVCLAGMVAFVGVGCGGATWEKQPQPFLLAAFEFATAIPDSKDAAQYQEKIVSAMVELGDVDLARRSAPRITNWRRGVAFADIAGKYFSLGDREHALSYLEKAEEEQRLATSWNRARIASHIARAWGESGDLEKIREIGTHIEEGEDQWSAFLGYLEALARTEGLEAALAQADKDFQSKATFVHTYMHPTALTNLLASKNLNLTEEEKQRVFREILKTMQTAPRSHEHAMYAELIKVCHGLHMKAEVNELADMLGKKYAPADKPVEKRLVYSMYQAQFEAMAGRKEAALDLLRALRPLVDQSAHLGFERCALMGIMIEAHRLAGDEAGARELFAHGLETAYREVNPRPRGMAYAEILLAAGSAQLPFSRDDRIRLQRDLARPWIVLSPDGKTPQG